MRFKNISKRKPKHKKKHDPQITTNINLLYANVRGIKGKSHDLEHKLKMHETHIATITETKLGTIPPKIEGFTWLTKNNQTGTGGIAIMVRNTLTNITKIPQFLEEDETDILWAELETKPRPTFIGVAYGKQENAPIDEVERQFQTITTHILTLKQKGKVILTGDLNAKINIQKTNHDNTTVHQTTSRNGRLLEKMLEETGCIAISTESKTGLWTRVNTKNENERSIIDYIIIPKEETQYVTSIEVDEEEVYRITGENKSDHNTITMSYDTTSRDQKTIEKTRWKVDNKEGWKAFNKKIEEMDRENKILNYEKLHDTVTQILKETIGEKKNQTRKNTKSQELKNAQQVKRERKIEFKEAARSKSEDTKEKLDRYIMAQKHVKHIIEESERKELEKKFNKFIQEGGVKSQSFWKIRKSILNPNTVECDLITENGEIITDGEQTKELIADYFEDLYQAREATPEEIPRTKAIYREKQRHKN